MSNTGPVPDSPPSPRPVLRRLVARVRRAVAPATASPTPTREPRGDGPRAAADRTRPTPPAGGYPGDFTGVPPFDYAPEPDGQPDAGEIVWAWVPFEEDHTRGKDRPVLLVGWESSGEERAAQVAGEERAGGRSGARPSATRSTSGEERAAQVGGEERAGGRSGARPSATEGAPRWLLALQLTSKDHDRDAEQERRAGRLWMDIGSGAWDARGRPSEVRLNRVIRVDPEAVRREGAALDRQVFEAVAAAARAALA